MAATGRGLWLKPSWHEPISDTASLNLLPRGTSFDAFYWRLTSSHTRYVLSLQSASLSFPYKADLLRAQRRLDVPQLNGRCSAFPDAINLFKPLNENAHSASNTLRVKCVN